jgi:hypothetical protein
VIPLFLNFISYTTYEDGTERSETSAHNIQTLRNNPNERIQHSEQGEILKSGIFNFINLGNSSVIRKYVSVELGRCNRISFNIKSNYSMKILITEKLLSRNFRLILTLNCVNEICTLNIIFFFYWRYNPLWVCILQPSSGL